MRFSLRPFRRAPHVAVLSAGAVALALGIIGTALATTQTGPFEVDDGTDSFAVKGYIYTANNATGVLGYGGNASAHNATGVTGYVTSPYSVGVTGYAASSGTNAYGVYGFSNTGDGVYGVTNNATVAAIFGVNSQTGGTGIFGSASGTGVLGESSAKDGVLGITTSTSNTGFAGVLGEDNSSANPDYKSGVMGTALNGTAVSGSSTNGSGGIFSSCGGNCQAVLASSDGIGGEFFGYSGSADTPVLSAADLKGGSDLIAAYSNGNGHLPESFIVQAGTADKSDVAQTDGSDVQISGDLYVKGAVYSYCSAGGTAFPETDPYDDCFIPGSFQSAARARSSSGTDVRAYSAHQSLPTMEDFGEGRLVDGQAAIPLDRTFAATIDTSRSYLVFITPEGDSKGLYVSSKSAGGFVVHESQSGHSTLAFQYRIVAHPYGDASTRFPAITAPPAAGGRPSRASIARAHLSRSMLPRLTTQPAGPVTLPQRLPPPHVNTTFSR